MREPKSQMLGTMEPPLMQLSVNLSVQDELDNISSKPQGLSPEPLHQY